MPQSRQINLSLEVQKDVDAMAESALHHLLSQCKNAVAKRGLFTIAISGGSTPLTMFKKLTEEKWQTQFPWEQIYLYWVDEHCVSPENEVSNFGQAKRHLLSEVPITHFYRMKGEEDPVQAAQAYEALLRQHFRLDEDAFPRFDSILLGMGEDGHTASLFPGEQSIKEEKRLVVDQFVITKNTDRLTMTLPVLNNARNCMFLVSGVNKHKTLSKVLNLLDVPTLPAQLVRPQKGNLIWITDEAAALGK